MILERSEPAGLLFPLLWLVAATAYAGWRMWAQYSAWYGSWLQAALLVAVIGLFVGAEASASYRFPARLIAWHGLSLLVMFCLIRQTTVTQEERHGLFTALLATGVVLAAYALYQAQFEFPRVQDRLEAQVSQMDAAQKLTADAQFQIKKLDHVRQGNYFGPFADPANYSCLLILLLPLLLFAGMACRKSEANAWLTLGVFGCALVVLFSLFLSNFDGGRLGSRLAVCLVFIVSYRTFHMRRWIAILGCVLALLGTALLFLPSGATFHETGKSFMELRWEYWQTSWKVLADHSGLGVGAGNFAGVYPRYMQPSSYGAIAQPHNLFLEAWASAGMVGFLACLFLVGYFFFLVFRALKTDMSSPPEEILNDEPVQNSGNVVIRWEFYVGGMAGLLLGFVLHVLSNRSDIQNVVHEGLVAGVRSLLWFVAYAVLEQVKWTDRTRAIALSTGLAAVFTHLFVNGGIGAPSVICIVLAAMAIALNSVDLRPVAWLSKIKLLAMSLPLPIVAGLMMVFYFVVYAPVAESRRLVRESEGIGEYLVEDQQRPVNERVIPDVDDPRFGKNNPRVQYVNKKILSRLHKAWQASPGDTRTWRRLAWWNWYAYSLGPINPDYAERAIEIANASQKLQPNGIENYLIEYEVRKQIAELKERSQVRPRSLLVGPTMPLAMAEMPFANAAERLLHPQSRSEYGYGADALAKFSSKDPANPLYHFLMAQARLLAGDKNAAREETRLSTMYDRASLPTTRSLTDRQRSVMKKWNEEK